MLKIFHLIVSNFYRLIGCRDIKLITGQFHRKSQLLFKLWLAYPKKNVCESIYVNKWKSPNYIDIFLISNYNGSPLVIYTYVLLMAI